MLGSVFSPVLLALALSLDGFGAGITYGMRKTKIPLLSILIISLCSGLVLFVSMQAGTMLQRMVSAEAASFVGAVILIALGCWSCIQQLRSTREPESLPARDQGSSELPVDQLAPVEDGARKELFSLEFPKLGLVIQILKSPSSADLDDSGSISSWEAMWLGIALSLDAFGAGLGAAMLGLSPLMTSCVAALFSGTFLLLGMKIGFRAAGNRGMRYIAYLPAMLLIVMGIMKLL